MGSSFKDSVNLVHDVRNNLYETLVKSSVDADYFYFQWTEKFSTTFCLKSVEASNMLKYSLARISSNLTLPNRNDPEKLALLSSATYE